MSAPPKGYYVPAVLFYDDKEEFDVPAIQAHVLRLAQGGVTGILVQGSNGEAQYLTREERKTAIALTRKTLDDNGFQNTLVIAGTGAQSTRETIQFCVDAKKSGASHALVLTSSTWPPQMTPDSIIRFHTAVADASPIPIMIYNFPTVTAGIDLDSDVIGALAAHPNIVGTKLSCGSIGKLHRLASSFPASEFATFAGKSEFFVQGLLSGGAGGITALVNIIPKVHGKAFALWKEGKLEEALALQAKMGHADWAVSKLGGIGGVKAVVTQAFGYGAPNVRSPLKSVNPASLQENKYFKTLQEMIELEKSL